MRITFRKTKTLESFTDQTGARWEARADDTHTCNGRPVTFAEYISAARGAEFFGLPIIQH